MRFLGIEITFPWSRRDAVVTEQRSPGGYAAPVASSNGGWFGGAAWTFPAVRESFTGAWQRGVLARPESVLSYHAVYACVTLIASDIGKLRIKMVEQDRDGIWTETTSPAFSPVLTKPNNYQNRIKFLEQWVMSKLIHGNAYVLKERDQRGVVTDLYVLDPNRVKALVAPDGAVYYQLSEDWLSGLETERVSVPASEIIHDTMNALFHPLVGTSPIFACGLAATQGLAIQRNSASFFSNGARPAGILTAPGKITDIDSATFKEKWQQNFTGENAGTVAVLGNGLAYTPMTMTSVDSQMIDQLKMTAEMVCSCYHVPPYMLGIQELPARIAVEALNQQYYTQCLQVLIESIELCLDEGLGLTNVSGHTYGTELDLDGLLRMDTAAQYKTYGDGILAGLLAPNEGRKKLDLKPLPGGDSAYLQQQNFSLSALSKRDAQADPFGTAAPKPADPTPAPTANDNAAARAMLAVAVTREWEKDGVGG